jgi:Xaa-Pro aminopeptidase
MLMGQRYKLVILSSEIFKLMDAVKTKLIEAEAKAAQLFQEAQDRGLIVAGKSEKQLNNEVFALALKLFGIEKYWHKRIIRSGPNTLQPYNENPPDLMIQEDDILFFDFGPIFEDWEADFGRTYVIGDDPVKHKLKNDIELAWEEGRQWWERQTALTGAEFFEYAEAMAGRYGWAFGGEIAGHLIGQFPHERLESGNYGLYVHPGNHHDMFALDAAGNKRNWILEIHFVDRERQIGGFFEQLLT